MIRLGHIAVVIAFGFAIQPIQILTFIAAAIMFVVMTAQRAKGKRPPKGQIPEGYYKLPAKAPAKLPAKAPGKIV